MYPEQRSRDRRLLALLLIAWLAIVVIAVRWGIPHIEDHLGGEGRRVLDGAGLGSVEIEFSGRNARLSGSVPSDADVATATQLIEQLWGVRTVSASIDSAATPAADPETAVPTSTTTTVAEAFPVEIRLSVTPEGGVIVIDGVVGSQVTAAGVNATAAAAYGRPVDDRLQVDAAVGEPAWTIDVGELLEGIGAIGGSLTIDGTTLTAAGVAPDAPTRAGIINAIAELDPELTIENQIDIDVITGEAQFVIDNLPGSTVLRGTVDTTDREAALVAAGERIYGSDAVTSELQIDPEADLPGFFDDPDDLFQALEGRRLDFIVHPAGVYLRGAVPGDEVRDSIVATVGDLVSPLEVIDELTVVEVDPETLVAVAAINDLIGTSVTFESGSPQLTDDATARLDEVADILIARRELTGVVEGHTDSVGSAADNLTLSEARARSVVDYLIAAGVEPGRLTSIGFGESRPVATNDTEEGRSANRRIEFKVEGSI